MPDELIAVPEDATDIEIRSLVAAAQMLVWVKAHRQRPSEMCWLPAGRIGVRYL